VDVKSGFGHFLLSTVERSAWTFIQTFLGLIIIEQHVSWVAALIASGIAAAKALSLGLSSWNSESAQANTSLNGFLKDMGERAISTFIQAFIGSAIAAHAFSLDSVNTALIAAAAAAAKCVYVVLAAKNPNSTLPLASDSSPPFVEPPKR
jgi:predicted tellurium resistance membrane protein TerC